METNFKLDGLAFSIQPLTVRKAFTIQSKVLTIVVAAQTGKSIGDDTLYEVAVKLLDGLTVDDYEVSVDEYFAGQMGLLNRVVFEALKLNFPDVMGLLKKSASFSEIMSPVKKVKRVKKAK